MSHLITLMLSVFIFGSFTYILTDNYIGLYFHCLLFIMFFSLVALAAFLARREEKRQSSSTSKILNMRNLDEDSGTLLITKKDTSSLNKKKDISPSKVIKI